MNSENVIIIDGDYADRVAFNLIVNFERIIGRRIEQADTARWIDCIALDGGIREGENSTSVVFVHDGGVASLRNFNPGAYETQLHGQAFSDRLGEFLIEAYPVEHAVVGHSDFFLNVVSTLANLESVKRVMIVPDESLLAGDLQHALRDVDDEKRITVFAMQPIAGGNFRQEILGYSLMNALGIHSSEIPSS